MAKRYMTIRVAFDPERSELRPVEAKVTEGAPAVAGFGATLHEALDELCHELANARARKKRGRGAPGQ